MKEGEGLMEDARNLSQRMGAVSLEEGSASNSGLPSYPRSRGAAESIASLSSMAQHARLLVGQFNCAGGNLNGGWNTTAATTTNSDEGRQDKSSGAAAKRAFAAAHPDRKGSRTGNYYAPGTATRVVDV